MLVFPEPLFPINNTWNRRNSRVFISYKTGVLAVRVKRKTEHLTFFFMIENWNRISIQILRHRKRATYNVEWIIRNSVTNTIILFYKTISNNVKLIYIFHCFRDRDKKQINLKKKTKTLQKRERTLIVWLDEFLATSSQVRKTDQSYYESSEAVIKKNTLFSTWKFISKKLSTNIIFDNFIDLRYHYKCILAKEFIKRRCR